MTYSNWSCNLGDSEAPNHFRTVTGSMSLKIRVPKERTSLIIESVPTNKCFWVHDYWPQLGMIIQVGMVPFVVVLSKFGIHTRRDSRGVGDDVRGDAHCPHLLYQLNGLQGWTKLIKDRSFPEKKTIPSRSLTVRPWKLPKPNRKGSSSNHHFSGATLNFRRVLQQPPWCWIPPLMRYWQPFKYQKYSILRHFLWSLMSFFILPKDLINRLVFNGITLKTCAKNGSTITWVVPVGMLPRRPFCCHENYPPKHEKKTARKETKKHKIVVYSALEDVILLWGVPLIQLFFLVGTNFVMSQISKKYCSNALRGPNASFQRRFLERAMMAAL